MADDSKPAATSAAKSSPAKMQAPELERKPIEHWIGSKSIAGFAPGTENHNCLMAGVFVQAGSIVGRELTECEFEQIAAEFLHTPIGYQVDRSSPPSVAFRKGGAK